MRLSIKGVRLTPLNNLNEKDNKMNQEKEFFDYCWEFYKPNGIYGKTFFNNTLTKKELKRAITIRTRIVSITAGDPHLKIPFEGDTTDREIVRDILLIIQNPKAMVEHFK